MKDIKPQFAVDFVEETAAALQVSESVVWALSGLAGLLMVFALGVMIQVIMINREKKMSFRSLLGHIGNTIWAVPVLAMIAFFGFRIATAGQPTHTPQKKREIVARDAEHNGVQLAFVPTSKAASWTERGNIRDSRSRQLQSAVLNARGAHVNDAETKLARQARELLAREYPNEFGDLSFGRLNAKTLKEHIVTKVEVQPGVETVGTYRNDASQVFWKLDLSPERRAGLREDIVTPRLWILGGAFALLTIIFVALAGYFRLDAKTEGRYRIRLKLATTALIVGSGIVLTAMLPLT